MMSAIQTKVYAGEGAKVELYVVQTMNAEAVCLHDVGVSCEKDAAVKECSWNWVAPRSIREHCLNLVEKRARQIS